LYLGKNESRIKDSLELAAEVELLYADVDYNRLIPNTEFIGIRRCDMDIQHLKCLFSVLSTNSFTEAGEMLHISQSGLSKQIVAVENELGIKILERNIRNIVLTPEGHRLMTHFIGILQCYDRLWMTIEDIKREKSDKAHVLKLIGVPPISKYNIISLIGNFSEQYANIEVVIEEMEMNLLLLTLQYGDYDLACCTDIQIDHMHLYDASDTEGRVHDRGFKQTLVGEKRIDTIDRLERLAAHLQPSRVIAQHNQRRGLPKRRICSERSHLHTANDCFGVLEVKQQ
jgi:hypothetical protein